MKWSEWEAESSFLQQYNFVGECVRVKGLGKHPWGQGFCAGFCIPLIPSADFAKRWQRVAQPLNFGVAHPIQQSVKAVISTTGIGGKAYGADQAVLPLWAGYKPGCGLCQLWTTNNGRGEGGKWLLQDIPTMRIPWGSLT